MGIKTDMTSAFKELTAQQRNRNLSKFKCWAVCVPTEQIAETPDIVWGGQGSLFKVLFKLRPKGSQERGEENVLGRRKSMC